MTPQAQIDKVLRLTVRLEQLARTTSGEIQAQIIALQRELAGILATENITTVKVLSSVRAQTTKAYNKRFAEIKELLGDSMDASVEVSAFIEQQYFASLGIAADKAATDAVTSKVIKRSLKRVMPGLTSGSQVSVGEMIGRFYDGGLKTVNNITQRAFSEGLSISKQVNLLRDATGLQRRQAEAVARTAIQAASNQARDDIAGALGAEKEMWLSTLDSATCDYCAGQDGKCQDYGTLPDHPAHPRCRCAKIYLPKGTSCAQIKEDMRRPQKNVVVDENGVEREKNIMKPYQDYGSWIQTQPREFQEEVLGVNKARLLREDKVSFNKLYTASGNPKKVKDLLAHYDKER